MFVNGGGTRSVYGFFLPMVRARGVLACHTLRIHQRRALLRRQEKGARTNFRLSTFRNNEFSDEHNLH